MTDDMTDDWGSADDYDPDDNIDSDAAEFDRLARKGYSFDEIMRRLRRPDQEREETS